MNERWNANTSWTLAFDDGTNHQVLVSSMEERVAVALENLNLKFDIVIGLLKEKK